LGSGLNGLVLSLYVHNGDLIAGGSFATAGEVIVNNIARWDGSEWQAIGSGMNMPVESFAAQDGYLIAGGEFTTAGGVAASRIARWDESEWHPMGAVMSGPPDIVGFWVSALAIHDGNLIAGGRFSTAGGVTANNIARWNGSEWHPLVTGMNRRVQTLTVHDGYLIAGGDFTTAGGQTASFTARWMTP